jgi:hypothetical protein
MKKLLVFSLGFYCLLGFGQNSNIIRTTAPTVTTTQASAIVAPIPSTPNSIWFDYDVNGNQIRRRQVYLASNRGGNSNNVPPEIKEEEKKYEESDIYSDVKYFPNPVVEILYVQWKNDNEKFVQNIQVFNLSGQLMGTLPLDRNSEQIEVDFRSYPSGFYELVLVYSDGNQKTLKIVKK